MRALCDRHFGVGGDGVLAILPSTDGDARMRVLNADGSEAEMCGNGIRCVAKVLYETDPALRRPALRIETGAGVLACGLDVDGNGRRVRTVAVEMGRPRLTRGEIPMPPGGRRARCASRSGARTGRSGSPPCRWATRTRSSSSTTPTSLRALAESYGPKLEPPTLSRSAPTSSSPACGAARIDLVVWERGSGITLACGTGACATVVAACLEERLAPGRRDARAPAGGHAVHHRRQGLRGVACAARRARVRRVDRRRAPDR